MGGRVRKSEAKRILIEGKRAGRAEGKRVGIAAGKPFVGLVRDNLLSLKDAAARANMTEVKFTARMNAAR